MLKIEKEPITIHLETLMDLMGAHLNRRVVNYVYDDIMSNKKKYLKKLEKLIDKTNDQKEIDYLIDLHIFVHSFE